MSHGPAGSLLLPIHRVAAAGSGTGTADGFVNLTGAATGTLTTFATAAGTITPTGTATGTVAGTGTLTVTHRQEFQSATGSTTMAATTSSFTPTAGSLLAVAVTVNAHNDSGVTTDATFAVTSTFTDTGGGTWTHGPVCTKGAVASGAFWMERTEIWTRLVGTSPSAGTVTATATGNAGAQTTTTDGWVWADLTEITGQHTSPIGASSGTTASQAAGSSTYNANLSGSPSSTSAVLTVCHQDDAPGTGPGTVPTGYTSLASENPAWGAASNAAYHNGGASSTVQWTGLATTALLLGSSLEIVAGSAGQTTVSGTAAGTLTASGTATGTRTGPVTGGAFIGTTPITNLRIGTTAVTGLYLGTTAVWPIAAVAARFPVAVAGRHFVDQVGDAWFGVGDSAWSLVGELGTADITVYLTDRAAKGFNLVLVSAPEHYFTNNTPATNNHTGQAPFTGTPFASTLNSGYWTVVDHAVTEAKRLGITLLLCPAYLGFASTDEGWNDEVAAVTNANMTTYGTALATRYGAHQNIMWLCGHDRIPDTTEKARLAALFDAIQAGTDGQLVTIGCTRTGSAIAAGGWTGSGVDYDFDTVYLNTSDPGDEGREAWDASSLPFGVLEGRYEGEVEYSNAYNDEPPLRAQIWGPFCAGSTYNLIGINPVWNFEARALFPYSNIGTWRTALDSPLSLKQQIFGTFVRSLAGAWTSMAPDTTDTFLTTGEGTGTTRAAAMFNHTGTSGVLAVAYRPDGGSASLTFDMTEFAATPIRIRKFDPAAGTYTTVGTFANTGTQTVGSFGTNAAGDTDWVIVFDK